jgi:SAM-dependent methyltransferase
VRGSAGEGKPDVSSAPSPWVARWAGTISPGRVLDLAAGGGRHSVFLSSLGFQVEAVDREVSALRSLAGIAVREANLEAGPWPYVGQAFSGIVVTNYLHRPLFAHLCKALAPGGVLIYETFMLGNERYGRPSNPDFLLRPSVLLEVFRGLQVLGFEQEYAAVPKPAMVQRLCARRVLKNYCAG